MQTFISAIVAGMAICLGAIASCYIENTIISAFIFTVGLTIILNYNLKLFTGSVGYCKLEKKCVIDNAIIWIGNLIGVGVFFIIYTASICEVAKEINTLPFIIRGQSIYNAKTALSIASLARRGVVCGMLMYLAVDGYKRNKESNPIIGIVTYILCVVSFLLIKAEHSVADMYYLLAFSETQELPRNLLRLLAISVGNAYGAIVIRLIINYAQKKCTKGLW